jgi:hypothetical protein
MVQPPITSPHRSAATADERAHPRMGANHTPNGLSAHRLSRVVTHLDKPCPLLGRAYGTYSVRMGVYLSRDPLFSRSVVYSVDE